MIVRAGTGIWPFSDMQFDATCGAAVAPAVR